LYEETARCALAKLDGILPELRQFFDGRLGKDDVR
jgi:hypothetical protein